MGVELTEQTTTTFKIMKRRKTELQKMKKEYSISELQERENLKLKTELRILKQRMVSLDKEDETLDNQVAIEKAKLEQYKEEEEHYKQIIKYYTNKFEKMNKQVAQETKQGQ